MESDKQKESAARFSDRIRKSWVPLAAVGGALTSFAAAALKTRPEPRGGASASAAPAASAGTGLPVPVAEPDAALKTKYAQTASIGRAGSPHAFRRTLLGVAVDSQDRIYGLGDDEIRVFAPESAYLGSFGVRAGTACLCICPDGRVLAGAPGRVDIYGPRGERSGSIAVETSKTPASVTAVKFWRNEILVADATARIIRRYDSNGNSIGTIGDKMKTGSFMLPNQWLDIAIAPDGVLYATDTGRHRVTGWMPDGSPTGVFGKFGMQDPADFVGCCNPVNIAVTPTSRIVTAEKMIARVKVFDEGGTLLAYIGPENFHPKCTHIYLAVDTAGRILAGDPLLREIKIFAPSAEV
jgi:hypothetical protein